MSGLTDPTVLTSAIIGGSVTLTAAILKLVPKRSNNGIVSKELCEAFRSAVTQEQVNVKESLKELKRSVDRGFQELKVDISDVREQLEK